MTTRNDYENALIALKKLILLGERHIPNGPKGAYEIENHITAYVAHLEEQVRNYIAHFEMTKEHPWPLLSPLPQQYSEGQWSPDTFKPTCGTQTLGEAGSRPITVSLDKIRLEKARKEAEEMKARLNAVRPPNQGV